jgi:hypothetical protein
MANSVPGTLDLVGPLEQPNAPILSAPALNAAINAQLALRVSTSAGLADLPNPAQALATLGGLPNTLAAFSTLLAAAPTSLPINGGIWINDGVVNLDQGVVMVGAAAMMLPQALPTAPSMLLTPADTSILVNIMPGVNNSGSTVTRFNIYMGTTSGSETLLASTTSNSYYATGLTNGTTYYFYAESVNAVGSSIASAEVACVPVFSTTVIAAYAPGVNLSGLETGDSVIPGTAGTNYSVPAESDLLYFSGKGIKKVRLPFLWGRLQTTLNGALNTTYLGYITSTIAAGHALGMTFILDCHNYATYNNGGASLTLGGPAVNGQGPLVASHFVSLWTQIATALKGTPGLAGYDIQNEPHDLQNASGAVMSIADQDLLWSATVQTIINAIGLIDSKTPIYVEGLDYSDAFNFWNNNPSLAKIKGTGGNPIVLEAHTYLDRDSSGTHFYWEQEVAAGDQLTSPPSVLDVNIGVKRTAPFLAGCDANGFAACIGETGVGNDNPQWNVALANMFEACQQSSTPCFYWCGGQGYSDYPLGIEPSGTTDTRQMAVMCYFANNADAPTTYLLSGPTRGTPSTASAAFTIDIRGVIASPFTITLNDGGAGGSFSPSSLSVVTGFNFLGVVTYTASATPATIVISGTNTGGLTNPSALGYSTIADVFSTIPVAPANILWPTLIDTTYIGPAIQLYRASDGATQTFNFVSGMVDHASIATWAGASAVSVVTAYDQSGTGQHAVPIFSDNQAGPPAAGTTSPGTQLNTNVNQYPAYVLNAYNGKPALRFAGSKMDAYSGISGLDGLTVLIAANPATLGDGYCMLAWDFVQNIQFADSNGNFLMSAETNQYTSTDLSPGTMNIYAMRFDGVGSGSATAGTITTFMNGTQVAQNAASEATIEFQYRENFNIGWYRFYPSSTNFDLGGYVVFPAALTNAQILALSQKMVSDMGITFPAAATGLTLNGAIGTSTIPVKLPVVPTGATQIVWQYRTTGSTSWNTALTENETAGTANVAYTFTGLTPKTNYDLRVVPYEGAYPGVASQLLAQQTTALTSGPSAPIAHIGFNIAGLDLDFSPTQNIADITRFAGYGFNVFRIPFKWENLYPTLPSQGGSINSPYVTNMLNYVTECTSAGVVCLLDMHNYAQYTPSGGSAAFISAGTAGAPTQQDLVTSWVTLASTSGIKNNPLVRLGIMNEPHLALQYWAPIHNAVVAGLRGAGITNIVHAEDNSGTALYPADFLNFTDSQSGGTIWEIHLYTDSSSAGVAAIPAANQYNYALDAQRIAGAWRQLTNPAKLFWGEVGFDSGAPAQIALPLFLQILQQNADVFDGLTFWSAGQEFGSSYVYNMNATNGVECPTTVETINYLPGGSNYGYNVPTIFPSSSVLNSSVATYTANGTGPFPHSTVMAGYPQVGETSLIFDSYSAIPPNQSTELTIEFWFNFEGLTIAGGPPIIGSNGSMYIYGNNSTFEFWTGNNSTRVENAVTMTAFNDGHWHHCEYNAGPAGIFVFIDGIVKYSSATTFAASGVSTNFPIGVRGNGKSGNSGAIYNGALACVSFWSTQKHTAAFTPPTDYYTGTEHGLLGYWPLNGDANSRA